MTVELKCFGSEYGHWCFIEHESLRDCIVISGGVGEDMSFDIDFASEYGAKVILYDPNPSWAGSNTTLHAGGHPGDR